MERVLVIKNQNCGNEFSLVEEEIRIISNKHMSVFISSNLNNN